MECVLQQETQNGDVSASVVSDDSFVDQLLNLSAENTLDDVDDHHSTASLLSPLPPPLQPHSAVAEEDDDFDSLLALPEEEADLEWLSHFVEDSFSQFCHASMPGNIRPPAVPPKSRRSKRLRPSAVRSWTLASPLISSSLTESTTSSSPSSSATSSPYCPTSPSTPLAFPDPPNSKKKKKKAARSMAGGSSSAASRRCSHCGTQKTPQWRAGPMGSKTLCNACGVRFKTGRLLPEYRPACSPTFSSVLHSNSHRKVLEMRRNKESTDPTEPGL